MPRRITWAGNSCAGLRQAQCPRQTITLAVHMSYLDDVNDKDAGKFGKTRYGARVHAPAWRAPRDGPPALPAGLAAPTLPFRARVLIGRHLRLQAPRRSCACPGAPAPQSRRAASAAREVCTTPRFARCFAHWRMSGMGRDYEIGSEGLQHGHHRGRLAVPPHTN